ncbi:hypothetical protein [Marinimicrococcus flavescens]|uniref:Uncharacterized protein n=1 Tax=Marinimicrococcus flavescens TaxID=3031815 RepID=A0AAP3UXU7_9PROT|nr:hypothetical protein [Marinimicrococcus flavescens]
MTSSRVRPIALALLLVLAAPTGGAAAQARDSLTLKERLGRKADDAQRTNDCKVPSSLRGDSRRPTACAARPKPPRGGRAALRSPRE